jgi:hypothetical protein
MPLGALHTLPRQHTGCQAHISSIFETRHCGVALVIGMTLTSPLRTHWLAPWRFH